MSKKPIYQPTASQVKARDLVMLAVNTYALGMIVVLAFLAASHAILF